METYHDMSDCPTYTKQNICDNTLDDAQLATRCPLDNARRDNPDYTSIHPRYSAGRLDQLPAELLIQVLLYLDIVSLTDLRRVNRRTMELVNSVPQYKAVIKHCPNIIRAILSLHADGFDCNKLYTTLSTSRCSTCKRFGDHLYLIACRRVCYFCFTRRPEYFPLTIGRASSLFCTSEGTQQRGAVTSRQRLRAAKLPSVLSLPGRYCTAWASEGGNLARKRLRLFDRQPVIPKLAGSGPPKADKTTREPRRFMAIITAPYLFDSGMQADWGYFCLGCKDETEEDARHFRTKYTREEMSGHVARHTPNLQTDQRFTVSPGRRKFNIPVELMTQSQGLGQGWAVVDWVPPVLSELAVAQCPSPVISVMVAASRQRNTNVRLLACLIDEDDTGDSDYRFLVDGQHVKYVTTAPGAFRGAEDDRTFEPILLGELFLSFPPGDWNKGHVARDPDSARAVFVRTERVEFPGVKNVWHPVTFNELDFTRQDRAETAAYQWLRDTGIGPKFLGHLTEGQDGRVIGIVAEWIEGAREAGPADLVRCKKALARVHELGIKLVDINKYNFLVRDGNGLDDVVLVDFETAERDCSPQELEEEMSALKSRLEDTSFLGGVYTAS
ncbi:hypothetical protein DV735_g5829, partial [Chaetothyriales sp. CBS 134920]